MEIEDNLPEHWSWMLRSTEPKLVELLTTIWQLAQRKPLQAALKAEKLWPEICDVENNAAWFLLVVITTARIHTLSEFKAFDSLIEFFENNRQRLKGADIIKSEVDVSYFGGLVFRRPGHQNINQWAKVCLQVFERRGALALRLRAANYLLIFRIWCGDLLEAEVLRQRMVVLCETCTDIRLRLLSHSASAMCLRLFIDYQACLDEIKTGLALAKQAGIREWDSHFYMQGAYLALCRENTDEAEQWLKKMEAASMPECYLDRSGYHYGVAWRHMLCDEEAFAYAHAKEAVRLACMSGALIPQAITHVALAQVYMNRQDLVRTFREVGRMRRISRGFPRQHALPFIRGVIHAHICFKMNMHKRGLQALRKAFAIGSEQRYVNFPWWRSHNMAELCARALEADIEPSYCRWIIRQRRLAPPKSLQAINKWYWPLRVELFQGGRLLLDGEEVRFGGKLSQLILILACLGRRQTWVSREKIADLLWPDSEGDKAERSLDTSIHRLRKQLHSEKMLQTRKGFVRLNPGLVQVDWELFRHQIEQADTSEQLLALLLKGLELSTNIPWEIAALLDVEHVQRRLGHQLYIVLSTDLAEHHNVALWTEEALHYLPENERLWHLLINVHLEHGYPAEALKVWERYKKAVAVPSHVIEALIMPMLS